MDHYSVIGNPIHHSKSPLVHRLFAEQTHQNILYDASSIALDQLALALQHFQAQQWRGLNITAPFKQQAYALVDRVSNRAMRAKAINTICFNSDGTRFGDNTDGIGLIRDITINQQLSLKGKRLLLLGAGGAVRGVLEALLNENPVQVTLTNRTAPKAQALLTEFVDFENLQVCLWNDLKHDTFDLIINGTGSDAIELPPNILNSGAYCYDMSYGAGVTPFIRWAKAHGAAFYSDGLGMLVEQLQNRFTFGAKFGQIRKAFFVF